MRLCGEAFIFKVSKGLETGEKDFQRIEKELVDIIRGGSKRML